MQHAFDLTSPAGSFWIAPRPLSVISLPVARSTMTSVGMPTSKWDTKFKLFFPKIVVTCIMVIGYLKHRINATSFSSFHLQILLPTMAFRHSTLWRCLHRCQNWRIWSQTSYQSRWLYCMYSPIQEWMHDMAHTEKNNKFSYLHNYMHKINIEINKIFVLA